ncbi:DUF2491 family protein [Methylocucumis oryzae]|uniref:DUF2491 domain-containing protein n=1 Tax=Methylocucumis oryzae TaxID=1632867 RepID=A0A0F3IME8_9GAMM|nr:DUF2491 family protein [Methylocucumis oryzae]KJV07857.1 hypothetical protein VZ94_02055 [Methylocucumis oryzae]
MFHKTNANKPRLVISLNSHVSVNLIDVIAVELAPAFIRPEGPFFIQAVGEFSNDSIDSFTLYVENNGRYYLIELDARGEQIEQVSFYQNILTLTPDEQEWQEILHDMAAKEFIMDDISYQRLLGGQADNADLLEYSEQIKTLDDAYECHNRIMIFERTITPGDFKERLKIVVEVIESKQIASVSFYLGFALHPSTLTLLGK